MRFPRSSGILLHPTSLPGPNGIGEIGPEALRFADWLAETGQRIWQVLPLGPTGYSDSPYQCFSAFAGNPLLLSLDWLIDHGYLCAGDTWRRPRFPLTRVDYGTVIGWKFPALARVADAFFRRPGERDAFDCYCDRNAHWFDNFASFMAKKRPSFDEGSTATGSSNSTGSGRKSTVSVLLWDGAHPPGSRSRACVLEACLVEPNRAAAVRKSTMAFAERVVVCRCPLEDCEDIKPLTRPGNWN